jgi:hypothetical protein
MIDFPPMPCYLNNLFMAEYQSENNNKYAYQEHEYRYPVDGVHVSDPTARGFVWIFFPDVKVFSKFAEYSHCVLVKDN